MSQVLNSLHGERPLVFGHRGARAYAPMNTLPSFALAEAQGADGIELDVWLSGDGHLVVIHNETVDDTTDGHGSVQVQTLAALKALDAGSWFDSKYVGTKIPTLEEVFEAIGQGLIVNVEIKTLGDDPDNTNGIEQAVADCITRHHMQERVIVSSFSVSTLKRFHAVAPEIAIGFLYATYDALSDPFVAQECQYLHPYHELLNADYVAQLPPLPLNTWTVNDEMRMDELLRLGVKSLITDVPDVARRIVDADRT